jgi:uncharacterized membrane protein (UPF0127 family)
MRAFNSTTCKDISDRLTVAESFFSRLKGLLGRKSLPQGEGLLLRPCKGIHTFGMRFPIDVLFLDRNNCVIAVVNNIRPNHMTRLYLQASSAIEITAGTLAFTATKTGDQIEIN